MPTIETAEQMLSDFEDILLNLPAGARADLGVELAGLQDVAGAADAAAVELPRRMGRNRASLDDD
jgi:hypothetical protein